MFPSKGHIWTAFHSRGPEHVLSMWIHSGRLCCIGCKHASYRSPLVQNGWCCAILKHHFSWSQSRKFDINISSPRCGRSPCGGWCAPPASPRTRTACTSGWSCSLFLQFLNRPTLRAVSCVGWRRVFWSFCRSTLSTRRAPSSPPSLCGCIWDVWQNTFCLKICRNTCQRVGG